MGRDTQSSGYLFASFPFQSTRPHGARQGFIFCSCAVSSFQSTRPHGARHPTGEVVDLDGMFQSTRPHGARRLLVASASFTSSSFNPRARMGRDHFFTSFLLILYHVSIHAPAWGATQQSCAFRPRIPVSIHAPAWGATPFVLYSHHLSDVSIHAPAWGATFEIGRKDKIMSVSIHAPAWGATLFSYGQNAINSCFNPRARMGRDIAKGFLRQIKRVSIHAPAWGATLFEVCPMTEKISFNPRARMGRDPALPPSRGAVRMFQSTRPHGARRQHCWFGQGR